MVIRALDAGALGYVLKPVTKEALSAMITRASAHSIARKPRATSSRNSSSLKSPEMFDEKSNHRAAIETEADTVTTG
jgi:FixJ family two-component response regulator